MLEVAPCLDGSVDGGDGGRYLTVALVFKGIAAKIELGQGVQAAALHRVAKRREAGRANIVVLKAQ